MGAVTHRTASLPYRALAPWLRERFGRSVRRVALDQGSTCPNRDGTKGFGGCFYCDVEGSGTGAQKSGLALSQQLERGLARLRQSDPDLAAVAYLQSYSNTYVSRERLAESLAAIEPHLGREVVALSVATRPDTLPESALDQLERLRDRAEIWVELGLESADESVLTAINRLHTVAEFRDAAARVRARGFTLVGHAILGLPGDGRAGAQRSAELLRETRCDGVKVHQLMVLEKTVFAKWWREGRLRTLEEREYVEWLADFLERLSPDQVVHRICGDAPASELLAPRWGASKNALRALLQREFERRGTRQGVAAAAPCSPPRAASSS
jgi:hypothetical protein